MKITKNEKQNILEKYYIRNSYNIITEQVYAKGDIVRKIQNKLIEKGIKIGLADGDMGPKTLKGLIQALDVHSVNDVFFDKPTNDTDDDIDTKRAL
jgi:hypothetical protein